MKTVIQSSRSESIQLRDVETGRMLRKAERDIITDGRGTAGDYLLRRIARDSPELLADIGKDKRLKSARAAAIEAGIIIPFPSLQLKDPTPTAQKLLAKKGKAWCLQLLEELSGLLEDPVSE